MNTGCATAMGDDKYLVFRFATEGGGQILDTGYWMLDTETEGQKTEDRSQR